MKTIDCLLKKWNHCVKSTLRRPLDKDNRNHLCQSPLNTQNIFVCLKFKICTCGTNQV